jgi:hypothetical protein
MSHSTHSGFRWPGSAGPSGQIPSAAICESWTDVVEPSGRSRRGLPVESVRILATFSSGQCDGLSEASGVGSDDKDPLAFVNGSDAASWNSKRPRGVALVFQRSEHVVERQSDDPRHVLSNDESGSSLCNDPQHLRPEEAVVRLAAALPGDGERLAGEAAGDEADPAVLRAVETADVGVARHARPALREDGAAEPVGLAEGDRLEARPFGGEVEAADAGEEGEVRE